MLEQGNETDAISSLKRAVYLNQDFVLGHFMLGNIFIKKGDRLIGKKHLNTALHILSNLTPEEKLPESDGLTVGRFTEMILAIDI
jgi:chemotaxis protein methyltransferase CheR